MRIAIRTDASHEIGIGHFMRCLTLADALGMRGVSLSFFSRDLPVHLCEMLTTRGHEVVHLDSSKVPAEQDNLAHSGWLATSQEADAAATLLALEDLTWNWIIVDHYALDVRWESILRSRITNIMVIDDLADRIHDCDLLLDQNLFNDMDDRYEGLVPDKCHCFYGPQYALLQPIYAKMRSDKKEGARQRRRILIYFGGADKYNLTNMTLAALEAMQDDNIEAIDVVLSKHSPHYASVRSKVGSLPCASLHSDLPSLAPIMRAADLSIGAGGATNWERLCMGLPSLVITVAENQRSVNIDLERMGLIELLGDVDMIDVNLIRVALEQVIVRDDLSAWSNRCRSVCNGLGTSVIVEKLLVKMT